MRGTLAGLVLALAAASCSAPIFSTRQSVGTLSIDGDVAASTTGGGAKSSAEALGFERDRAVYQPRVDLEWQPAHLAISYFQSEHSGDGIAESTLQLDPNDPPILPGDLVRSDLDLAFANAALTFDLVPSRAVDVGLGFGLGAFSYDGSIEAPATGARVASEETFPVGFLAARGVGRLGDFALELDLAAVEFGYDADELSYFDLDLALAWRFFDDPEHVFVDACLGWRSIDTDLSFEDQGGVVEADLSYSGPYLGVQVGL